MITILASIFLVVIIAIAVLGFRAVITQGKSPEDLKKEKCSICRTAYPTSELVEREVGDYRLLYFCPSCIESLRTDLKLKG